MHFNDYYWNPRKIERVDKLKQKNILFCITSITSTDLSAYVLKVIMRFQERQDTSPGCLQNFATCNRNLSAVSSFKVLLSCYSSLKKTVNFCDILLSGICDLVILWILQSFYLPIFGYIPLIISEGITPPSPSPTKRWNDSNNPRVSSQTILHPIVKTEIKTNIMKLDGVMEPWGYLVFCELAICLSSNRAAMITSLKLIYPRYISHCQQKQSYSGLRSPGRSNSTFWYPRYTGSTIVFLKKTLHYRSRDYNTALNNLPAICLKA